MVRLPNGLIRRAEIHWYEGAKRKGVKSALDS